MNYNEKEVDYGLGESEDDDEPVRPKANVDFEGAEADEIEGVFGWARDETRIDDPVDLPYENIVSLESYERSFTNEATDQPCISAIPHQMEILLPSSQHGRAVLFLQVGKLPRTQTSRQLHQVDLRLRAAYATPRAK